MNASFFLHHNIVRGTKYFCEKISSQFSFGYIPSSKYFYHDSLCRHFSSENKKCFANPSDMLKFLREKKLIFFLLNYEENFCKKLLNKSKIVKNSMHRKRFHFNFHNLTIKKNNFVWIKGI